MSYTPKVVVIVWTDGGPVICLPVCVTASLLERVLLIASSSQVPRTRFHSGVSGDDVWICDEFDSSHSVGVLSLLAGFHKGGS